MKPAWPSIDGHSQQEDADEDKMELDQAQMQAYSVCYNHIDSNGLEVGKMVYTAEDSYGDNSYLDSLLPHWNSESGINFNSPSASHLFGYQLSDIRKQPSHQEDYGYQLQLQGQPEGNRAPYTAESSSSSSFAFNGEAYEDGAASHSSMPLRVDFSAFHDQMRQYQQAAIANQNDDSSIEPYFQQSSRSEASAPAQSTRAQIAQVSTENTTTPSLRHSSAASKESSADIGNEDRRWLDWVEQASQKQEFDAPANENPTNAYFARHLVNFSRALWEASDVSHENGTIADKSRGEPPASQNQVQAGGWQSNPYSLSSSATVGQHQGHPAFRLAPTIPARNTLRKHSADVSNRRVTNFPATRKGDGYLQQYWDHSSQQHVRPQSQAHGGEADLLSPVSQSPTGTSERTIAPDWSQASRQRLRTIAPLQIPKCSSKGERSPDGAQTSLCTPGSSTGPFQSPFDAAGLSSGLPPLPLKRKGSTASSIQEVASQSTSGKGSYECNTCGRKFSRPSALVVHERVHSGEQPYLCETCNRAFTVASNLRRHQKTHTQQLYQIAANTTESGETIRASTVKQKTRRRKRDHGHGDIEGDSQESDLSR